MITFLIALFSVILVLTCLFVVLLVLMQKPSANSGMGAALGGGAAEQAFGGEATNVLTRGTIYAVIAFFVLSFALYLGSLHQMGGGAPTGNEGASLSELSESAPAAGDEDSDLEAAAASDEEEEGSSEETEENASDEAASGEETVEEAENAGAEMSGEATESLRLEDLDSESTNNP